jgi:NADH:ubiquinone oxidoreductase subunit 3 (subunit A)
MLPSYSITTAVVVFSIVCLALLGFMLFISWAVRPMRNRPLSQQTYECGFTSTGDARNIGFNYFHFAVLFLVFDVAALFLFLYASSTFPASVTISFLLGILTLGLMILYGTKKRRYYGT